MNPEDLTPEQFQALTEADRLALLTGDSLPPEGEALPVEGEPPVPAVEAAPVEQGVSVPQPEPTAQGVEANSRGDLNVALAQERQRRHQLEAILQDPAAIAQLAAQYQQPQAPPAPDLAYEDPAAIQAIVAQAVAPIQQQLQAVMAENQRLAQERQLADMRQRHPDLDQHVSEFDSLRPDLVNAYNPEEKKLMLLGARAADPAWIQAQVEAEATKRAEALLAEKLAGLTGKDQPPITLAGVTAAKPNDAPPDLATLSRDQFMALDDRARTRLLGG